MSHRKGPKCEFCGNPAYMLQNGILKCKKRIKSQIAKKNAEAYCKANGLVMVPEETINKMEDLYGILDGTHKRLKHETEDILGGIIDDIAAFKEQAI